MWLLFVLLLYHLCTIFSFSFFFHFHILIVIFRSCYIFENYNRRVLFDQLFRIFSSTNFEKYVFGFKISIIDFPRKFFFSSIKLSFYFSSNDIFLNFEYVVFSFGKIFLNSVRIISSYRNIFNSGNVCCATLFSLKLK